MKNNVHKEELYEELWKARLIPRPSHPSVCCLQYYLGGRPSKTDLTQWRTWTCGGVAHSRKNRKWMHYRSKPMVHRTECSTSDSLGNVSWVQEAALQLYRRNVPLLHMSRYIITHDQSYQAFPYISTSYISISHWAVLAHLCLSPSVSV